eukprot:m.543057 g.543057  ORF g.543057 m.543057 type:complete len:184 (-) comp57666_c0_seq12:1142-1693(-)
MGDRAWLAFFVRPNKSAVVRYPSADEVEQYKASLATQSAQQTAKYALLEDHLRLQLDAVGTEYTTGLVPGIIRELLSHGEKRAHQEAALTERKVVGSRRLIFDTLGPSNPQILSQHCIGSPHRMRSCCFLAPTGGPLLIECLHFWSKCLSRRHCTQGAAAHRAPANEEPELRLLCYLQQPHVC